MPARARELSAPAVAFRALHTLIAAGFLAAIGYVWWCALTGRRDPVLHAAAAALVVEGACVAANGGDCPLGPLPQRVGDPVPLFELVLPLDAARSAVPCLGVVAAAGILALGRFRSSYGCRFRPVRG